MSLAAASQVAATLPVAPEIMNAQAITAIIGNVNGIYVSIFTFIAIFLTVLGLIFPVVLTKYQNKKLEKNEKKLSEKITKEMDALKTALIEDLRTKLAEEISIFEKKIGEIEERLGQRISKSSAIANAKAHFLQAKLASDAGKYGVACRDYAIAVHDFAGGGQEANMQQALRNLVGFALPNAKKADFDNDDEIEKECQLAEKALEKLNVNARYEINLKDFRTALKEAKKRV
jgi:hypothetical protein